MYHPWVHLKFEFPVWGLRQNVWSLKFLVVPGTCCRAMGVLFSGNSVTINFLRISILTEVAAETLAGSAKFKSLFVSEEDQRYGGLGQTWETQQLGNLLPIHSQQRQRGEKNKAPLFWGILECIPDTFPDWLTLWDIPEPSGGTTCLPAGCVRSLKSWMISRLVFLTRATNAQKISA